MMQKWDGFWSAANILSEFDAKHVSLTDDQVIYAFSEYEDYLGSAWVLFHRDGKLYEVFGSHCSCNGFEGQWHEEETSIDAVMMWKRSGELTEYLMNQFVVLLDEGKIR